jgi:hypothetical protein
LTESRLEANRRSTEKLGMRRTPRLPRACVTAVLAVLAATTAIAAPASASAATTARHDAWWTSGDADSWEGAGGGWNGGSWRDAQSSTGSTWTPQDTRELEVRNLEVDRSAISPNGDGEGDDATVSFRLRSTSAPVNVRVVDAAGTTVRQLGEQQSVRTDTDITWDGRNDAGAIVADGEYRIVLTRLQADSSRADGADPLAIDVAVDTTAPALSARRPTLAQLVVLARRAAAVRDAEARWARRAQHRHRHQHGSGRTLARHDQWSSSERDWVRLWESQQLRLPVTFTTGEDGNVSVTAKVGGATSSMETWRSAGTSSVNVVLPRYAAGQRAQLTLSAADDAGNVHRHTIVVLLARLPAPRKTRRSNDGDRGTRGGGGSTAAPVTGVPTNTAGPFPDWLDPIMLRATYAAGVPQSWAKSQALANIVSHESSFRATAQNPTSTAYGLFQFLNTTWATVGCTKTSDAYQQSVCGLRYIQRRYHTPEAAWAFWQRQSPHWY